MYRLQNYFLLMITMWVISCIDHSDHHIHLNLENQLPGKWTAKAFDGELHEEWILNKNGWMQQVGYYIENTDTSYSAITRIEKVNNELILFSVIKGANPKIFKAVDVKEDEIVFENDDYKNPFQVTYKFFTNEKYRRTIKGVENDSTLIYIFDFEKYK